MKSNANDPNKYFVMNLDHGKLYTNRFVERLKFKQRKIMDKFTLGSKYALVA